MKIAIFTLLTFIICSFSPIYAENGANYTGSEVVSINLESADTDSGEILEAYNSPITDGNRQLRRKEKRIQVGKDILNAGVSILDFSSQEAVFVTVFIASPILVVGSAVLIWGALTRDPTKNR